MQNIICMSLIQGTAFSLKLDVIYDILSNIKYVI